VTGNGLRRWTGDTAAKFAKIYARVSVEKISCNPSGVNTPYSGGAGHYYAASIPPDFPHPHVRCHADGTVWASEDNKNFFQVFPIVGDSP
jgi:hypothetical protein